MKTRDKILFNRACALAFALFFLMAPMGCRAGSDNHGAREEASKNDLDAAQDFPITWQLEPGLRIATENHALAPDVFTLEDGTFRAFFTVTGRGVGSAVSEDGLDWDVEPGLRIISRRDVSGYREGEVGFDLGHPWLVRMDDGRVRMFLQANSGLHTPLRIVSAVSGDDYNFELEPGIRMDIGPESGPPALSFAGHGRSWRTPDGGWGMVFSGNLLHDRNPSDIMLAVSDNGLDWEITEPCLFNNGHDPALLEFEDGRLAMVFTYLRESLRVSVSDDHGETWSPAQKLVLLDEDGEVSDDVHGDVALMHRPDGGLRMLSNGIGGIVSFIPAE